MIHSKVAWIQTRLYCFSTELSVCIASVLDYEHSDTLPPDVIAPKAAPRAVAVLLL